MSAKTTTYAAPALEKGFNVIELLANEPDGLSISEIASGLGLSISEIFRVIMVMERRRWLKKRSNDKYCVTPRILALAFKATPAEELSAVAASFMRDFSLATDQSCHLVIPNGDKGLLILRQQNPGPNGFYVRIGTELDLETTCSGRVLLAFSRKYDDKAADDSAKLSPALTAIRQRGYERMESSRTLGVTDVSFPIFDFHGDIAAALTMPFLKFIDGTQRMTLDEAQLLLGAAAQKITDELLA
ncbi:IclR family transcriptional regulator [Asticcacaulis sp. SL142]|uniref:IclR family transcriptional regulator n=1 Tax=Asticcacaulis sp. SL142 TaxID=2995155 RepID=UPI00226CFE39|nr:IclR family transcriptional regulator [Asticcacaulis sp. SL142]WAC48958.1 IclR family transcriptional regulator [Asticcacaulis sp. SL142]